MTEATTTTIDPYAGWKPQLATIESDGKPDTLIVPLVEALRAKGLVTRGSCQGHPGDECRQPACVYQPELCYHPGQLSVDARTLDPVSALRVESDCFLEIACVTYPRFIWYFKWGVVKRDEAIERLFGLKVMKS